MTQDTKWRILPRNSDYIVSENGEIAKLIKPRPNIKGYMRCAVLKPEGRKVLFIHRAVALAWIPNPKNKATVNHRNMIVDDNRSVNLEWMTNAENRKHRSTGGTPVADDSMTEELWRNVPGFDGYISSNKGGIAKVMKPKPNDTGYLKIKIQYDFVRKDFYMQRLVAEAWIEYFNEDDLITHINENRSDNRLSNLRITTQKEIIRKSVKGRTPVDQKGMKNPSSKIGRSDVHDIRRRYDSGETPKSIAIDYPIGTNMVWQIGRRMFWAHVPELLSPHDKT